MIIVIDGPAGSGKSSTARAVAKRLGIEYIDSGGLYRAITLLYLKARTEKEFLENLAASTVSFRYQNERFEVQIGQADVTPRLRSVSVAEKVSTVAAMPCARSFVNNLMQKKVEEGVYIADGRDLGTAVFPDADVKFFMQADSEIRAERRFAELKEAGEIDVTLQDVHRNILLRDKKDSGRKHDPLKKASDAITIDTSDINFDEQVLKVCSLVKENTNIKS